MLLLTEMIQKKILRSFFVYFLAGKSVLAIPLLVANLVFLRDVWIRIQRAAIGSSHNPILFKAR
jgi:hypothetical protein